MATSKLTYAFWWTEDSSRIVTGNSCIFASAVGTIKEISKTIFCTPTCLGLTVTLTDVVSCGMNIMVKFNHSHHLLSSKHVTNCMILERKLSQLMERQTENYDMARLLASVSKHSGDWLHAIPISFCCFRLDDEVIRIAVGLRLGLDICEPHTCVCGAIVDVKGSHALSCKRSSG